MYIYYDIHIKTHNLQEYTCSFQTFWRVEEGSVFKVVWPKKLSEYLERKNPHSDMSIAYKKIYKSIPIPYQLERGRSRSRERRGMLGWMLAESHCLQPLGNLPIYTSSLLPQCAEFGKPWQWYWDNMFCSIGWLLVIWIISITKRTSII